MTGIVMISSDSDQQKI